MIAALHPPTRTGEAARIDGERRSQRLVTAFVISGLVFMPPAGGHSFSASGSIRLPRCWSLHLLFAGCLLRVIAEPLAYENIWAPDQLSSTIVASN
jgi:hypothetical protein